MHQDMSQLSLPLHTTQLITLGGWVGEHPARIEYCWDFLWKLGYHPYRYDRMRKISLGDVAVGHSVSEALRNSHRWAASGGDLILCTIPMVRRAVRRSRLAGEFNKRLNAMKESIVTGSHYAHLPMAKPEQNECNPTIDLAFRELAVAMAFIDRPITMGSSLGRAAAWSLSGIEQTYKAHLRDALQKAESRRQVADILTRFPAAHKWPHISTTDDREREIRFRRISPIFPFQGDAYYDPVIWPIVADE